MTRRNKGYPGRLLMDVAHGDRTACSSVPVVVVRYASGHRALPGSL